ncbi:MAG: LysR family transcriptional regulator substrate-binding protein [Umezawaea sp.]
MTGPDVPTTFTLAYVPGVTPTKWTRLWNERLPKVSLNLLQLPAAEAADAVRTRTADAALLRLPVDRTGLHAIPLYTETTVVVVPKDHVTALSEELSPEDLADEIVLHPLDDALDWEGPPGRPARQRPATTAAAVELVAAGIGLLVVPQSLARLHHRKDLTYRTLTDAPESRVALSWTEDETTDLIDQLIGIVRGRTVNSTRGRPPAPAKPEPAESRKTTKGKPAARTQQRRAGASKGGKRGKPRGR